MLTLRRKLEMREDSVSKRKRPLSMSYSSKPSQTRTPSPWDWARLETYAAGAYSTALRAPTPLAATPRLAHLQSSQWRMSLSALLRLAACREDFSAGVQNLSPNPCKNATGQRLPESRDIVQWPRAGPSLHDAPIEERFTPLLGADREA